MASVPNKLIHELKGTNEEVEGLLRGFNLGEAGVAAVLGCFVGGRLLTIDTENGLLNAGAHLAGAGLFYLGVKATERVAEAAVPIVRQAIQEVSIASVL